MKAKKKKGMTWKEVVDSARREVARQEAEVKPMPGGETVVGKPGGVNPNKRVKK